MSLNISSSSFDEYGESDSSSFEAFEVSEKNKSGGICVFYKNRPHNEDRKEKG